MCLVIVDLQFMSCCCGLLKVNRMHQGNCFGRTCFQIGDYFLYAASLNYQSIKILSKYYVDITQVSHKVDGA